ncbi:MAG: cbb3-type cytochrome oxidase assembly protein CcoS [Calditrichaeota bacterium]|nr:MAG: cbb3-type cytochrome oxidase assembly protein CcoS [Calditrichota bacterium]MBL1204979.1 cbb3-type cytochrome oxidase assembly protein CcoS [Calditrichota bacterium]NOG44809.1 cbb3-type cytochrome oxidase assembly protein CcoS [Calditrichota bacterium]
MEVIFILIGASFSVALGFLIAFLFSVKKGQFDDQETPAIRMLFDDEIKK